MLGRYGIVPEPNGHLSFKVKACKDAFILLSANFYLRSQLFYEIGFGCSDNKIIYIHRISSTGGVDRIYTPLKSGADGVKTASTSRLSGDDSIKTWSTPKILSCKEYRPFTVRWFLNGTIQVEKSSKIVLKWTDPFPIPVHGLGIMTSYGSRGSWIIERNAGIRLMN